MIIPTAKAQAGSLSGPQDLVALVPHINIQIFCESQQTVEVAQLAAADRRMQRAHTAIHMGGIQGAFHAFQTQVTPNLLIVESGGTRDAILTQLASLAEVCHADTKVVVIGHVNDVVLYRELVQQGVSEYLVAPIQQIQLIQTIASLYRDPTARPLGRVLAFIGAKGGVGSSSLAHSVGWTIAKTFAVETVIADLDLAFGTAGLNFNVDIASGITDVLGQPDRVDMTLIERMLMKAGGKLSLLGGPGGVERDFQIEPAAVETILNSMRASIPCIVLDIPALWAPWVKFALLHSDQVIITATPDLVSLRNTRSMIDVLKTARPNDAPPKIVMNQVGIAKRPEISGADFSKAAGVPISANIPFDAQTFGVAQSNGQMIFDVAPKAKASVAISELVPQLWGADKSTNKVTAGTSLLQKFVKLRKK